MANPEITLWRSVIAQAFLDAANKTHTSADRLARGEARDWLLKDSPGFRAVCDAADVEPRTVRRNAERQQVLGWPVKRTTHHRVGCQGGDGAGGDELASVDTSEEFDDSKLTKLAKKRPLDDDADEEDIDDGRPLDEMLSAPQVSGVFV